MPERQPTPAPDAQDAVGTAETDNADAQATLALEGGSGGASRSMRETRMLAKALREHWPITPDMRRKVVARLMTVVEDHGAAYRETISACKALIDADRVNLDASRDAQPSGGVTLHVQTVVVDGHTAKTTVQGKELAPPNQTPYTSASTPDASENA